MSTTPYVDPSALPTDQQGPYNPPPAPDQPQPQMQPQGASAPQIDPAQTQQGPTGSQPAAPPPTADAAPQPFWKTLLRGALSGLAGGAGAHNWGQALGQGAGAEMKMQQQDFENKQSAAQNASTIRFRDAQSAYNAALLAKQGALIQNMDAQQRDAYDKVKMDAIKLQQQSGRTGHWIPSGQTEDHLNSLTAQDPDGVHVPSDAIATSFGTWQWDSDTDSGIRQQYQNLKALAPYYNGGAVPSEQNFMTAKPAEREKMISGLNNLIAGRSFGGPEFTAANVDGPIQNIQAQLEKARKDPNAAPTVVPMLQNTLDHLLNQKNGVYGNADDATARQIKVAGARGVANNMSRVVDVIDPNSGTITPMTNADRLKAGAASAGPGMKAGSGQAQINDITTGSQAMRRAIHNVTPLSIAQVGELSTVMNHDGDPSVRSDMLKAFLNKNTLSEDQKDFVVAANQLNERALSLRSVAGMGNGSDQLRSAIRSTLPGAASGDKSLMLKQLDAFDQQVQQLSGGMAKVRGLAGNTGSAAAHPQTHLFDSHAWAAANPGKDVNAAIAYAKQQGYTVK